MSLSRSERLQVIEKLAVQIAQQIIGGVITGPNHPDGDLCHSDGYFTEVKSANSTSGAIIRKKQLRKHCRSKTRNYVLVFHSNRSWSNGRWYYTTLRKCQTAPQAQKYLVENITEVYIIGVGAMRLLYQRLRRRGERTHYFKSGPKTYIKLRSSDFFPLLLRAGYGQSSKYYSLRVGPHKLYVPVTRIYSSP
jgi:hypothetical protein